MEASRTIKREARISRLPRYQQGSPTCPCSRPLRARDRWHFDSCCDALAAADGQAVGPHGYSRHGISMTIFPQYALLSATPAIAPKEHGDELPNRACHDVV